MNRRLSRRTMKPSCSIKVDLNCARLNLVTKSPIKWVEVVIMRAVANAGLSRLRKVYVFPKVDRQRRARCKRTTSLSCRENCRKYAKETSLSHHYCSRSLVNSYRSSQTWKSRIYFKYSACRIRSNNLNLRNSRRIIRRLSSRPSWTLS